MFPDEFPCARLVPLLHDDEGVAQVDPLEVAAQTPIVEVAQPMDDMALALLISLEQGRDPEHYPPEILGGRSELLGKAFNERALYHVTPMRKTAL